MNHTFLHVDRKESLKMLPCLNSTEMFLTCWTVVMPLLVMGSPHKLVVDVA